MHTMNCKQRDYVYNLALSTGVYSPPVIWSTCIPLNTSHSDGCVAETCLSSDPAVVSKCAMFTIFSQITNFKFHDKYDNTTYDYINGYIK